MIDINENAAAVELVEAAEREYLFCSGCAELNQMVERNGSLWLECPTLATSKPLLKRLLTLDFSAGHTRRLVLDAPAVRLAA